MWGYAGTSIFFCLGALLLNYLLYRSRLVPRWIAGWALVAVAPYLVDAVLVMFSLLTLSSAIHATLVFPLALNVDAHRSCRRYRARPVVSLHVWVSDILQSRSVGAHP
jgi:hypothetical protein